MMNIAFIHTVFPGGGAERVTFDIAKGMHQSFPGEFSLSVFTPRVREELLTPEYSETFKKIIPYNPADEENEIMSLIKKEEIDVIVQIARRIEGVENIKSETGCRIVFANHGEPFHLQGEIIYRKQNKWWRRLLWYMGLKFIYVNLGKAKRKAVDSCRRDYESCDVYTVLCDAYKNEICKGLEIDCAGSHIKVINNCEHPADNICWQKENMVLFAGRFEQFSKRIDRLLRIWNKFSERLPDWKLVLAGDGYDLDLIKRMAERMKLKNVDFVGFQEDMSEFYSKASVLCLTSQSEGWGLCLTEAQANGVVPIAFGCSEAVKYILSPNGVNGFIVEPFDENEFLETLYGFAVMDEDEKMCLRHNVVEKAKSYSPEVISRKWRNVFNELKSDSYDKDIL